MDRVDLSTRAEAIRIGDEYYLLASALAARRPQLVLVDGPTFAVVDTAGDIPLALEEPYGVFHRGTRHLSRLELRVDGDFPILLSSSFGDEDCELVTHLSNPDRHEGGEVVLPRDTVAIRRTKVVGEGVLAERIEFRNFGCSPVALQVQLLFDADFADVFEIRGVQRERHGRRHAPAVHRDRVVFRYDGLDGRTRRTEIAVAASGLRLGPGGAGFPVALEPREQMAVEVTALFGERAGEGGAQPGAVALREALLARRRRYGERFARVESLHEPLNQWIARSAADLALLCARGPQGRGAYTQAGIPWFATLFGRDALVTAFEVLAFAPSVAEDTLRCLAAYQGRELVAERDEEPGKIVHEVRDGEMAATGEVPFGRYYGSIDSTPLFILLLAEHAERVGSVELVRELWPNLVAATRWMEEYGDADGDGYLEYRRRGGRGLVNQGWKDSHDAVMHEDGSLATPPIALAEVQAYAYGAWVGAARLARRLGREAEAERWRARAVALRARFSRDFWMADRDFPAMALDGHKRPCRVLSSNGAQCLLTGILDEARAGRLVRRLLWEDIFCGWGVRTLSSREAGFNPMSYHNGSVWPHDNALIAAGCARYGYTGTACRVLEALFDASGGTEGRRLPELFCGFARDGQARPVPYPVACRPQAWAAASVFLLLQSALGMIVDGWHRRVAFAHTELPAWLPALEIRGLRIGDATLDLNVVRGRWGAAVEVVDKQGDVEVVVRK